MNDRFQCGVKVSDSACRLFFWLRVSHELCPISSLVRSSPAVFAFVRGGFDRKRKGKDKKRREKTDRSRCKSLSSTGNKQNRGKTDRRDAFVVTCLKNQKTGKSEGGRRTVMKISVENCTSFGRNGNLIIKPLNFKYFQFSRQLAAPIPDLVCAHRAGL